MSGKLSSSDARWVADARAQFIEKVDGKEIAAFRAQIASLTAERDEARARVAQVEGERDRQYDYNVGQIAQVAQLEARIAELEATHVLAQESGTYTPPDPLAEMGRKG